MTVVAGTAALAIGLAYVLIGGLAVHELGRDSARRGFSRFGAAFVLMAFTCGVHHLVCATHMLAEGQRAAPELALALLLGLPPALAVAFLRVEALAGGAGDRLLRGNPLWLLLAPWLATFAAGGLLASAVGRATADGASAWGVAPNVVLFAGFVVIGGLAARSQLARRAMLGGWSLSGCAMAAVFPTCGVAHLAAGLTLAPDGHMLAADLAAVPAALLFLWIVHRVQTRSLPDWNRRPLVGRPRRTRRPSPWAPVGD